MGCPSHHRAAQQDQHHLRTQGNQTLPGGTQNGHRRSGSTESRDSQPLWQRIHQTVRARPCDLRTEPASKDVADYGVKKAVENLPQLRQAMGAVIDNYLTVQQDILETFVDRGQLRKLSEPTVLPNGKRIPGLKIDNPRQLAVMHALVRFANIAAGSQFSTRDLHNHVAEALGVTMHQYTLGSLRYDLSKLRAKDLVKKVEHTRRYRLTREGYSICVVFLKLFERIYAPLTAGLLPSVPG